MKKFLKLKLVSGINFDNGKLSVQELGVTDFCTQYLIESHDVIHDSHHLMHMKVMSILLLLVMDCTIWTNF